ncbi:shikimate kinase [Olsenella sp. Marseille-P4559]|uniref:shikimate kinase n=1 Tax=Olsenella sp. Marseille-P4559 TaxID=2364795 RepID=UPI00103096E1|nr:shikimate kinase [Olsenella sp. Marseille-P4559]
MAGTPNAGVDAGSAPFGLLGRNLGHSWSPRIHTSLGSVPYELFEREPDDVEGFVRNGTWSGLNVTIPYKRDAARLADERSPRVDRLGAANTLVRRPDGTIYAENTDVLGFSLMLNRFCTRRLGVSAREVLAGKPAVVLGSGGASAAVQAALDDAGALVSVISRSGSDTYETLAERHADAVLMVNATPVGMYPNCPASPVPEEVLAQLKNLVGVLDVIYNPTLTGIVLAAERLGIPADTGLSMLVAQALRSSELFQGRSLDVSLVDVIERQILSETSNVVLIGMPGCGKTTTGKRLARMLGRPFVDIDDAIDASTGESAATIINTRGVQEFRRVESRVTGEYGARSGLVIACGGGVVTVPSNYDLLHQNGTIVFIDRSLSELETSGRPVSASKGVEALARERMGSYRSWADYSLVSIGSPAGNARAIQGLLGL